MKKALLVATVPSMIDKFNMNNIRTLQKIGYEVHVSCNFFDNSPKLQEYNDTVRGFLEENKVKCHQISFSRSPFSRKTIAAVKELKKVVSQERFQLIHGHTPVGGVIARAVGALYRTPKLIYTAHGFHFFKGAPILNWIMYYPVEWLLSFFTTDLITINQEDYHFSKKYLFPKRLHKINGVGIDLSHFQECVFKDETNKLKLFSIGELNTNKNHRLVIEAINQSIYRDFFIYHICGQGPLLKELEDLVQEYHLEEQVKFLGYRSDIVELLPKYNVFVFPSKREGLPVSVMEAMAMGLPVIASNIRGNNELIDEKRGGFLFEVSDVENLKYYLDYCYENKNKLYEFGKYNTVKITKYSIEVVNQQMTSIYR